MRAFIAACSLLVACSEVTIVPNDGGGSADVGGVGAGVGVGFGGEASVGAGTPGVGGASSGLGGGGGSSEEWRLIEIALVEPLNAAIEDVGVLVNGANGELRASYSGSELPVMAEVLDGDLVSFYVPDPDPGKVLRSYRVRPAVWRIAEGASGLPPCNELDPMVLAFDIPAVDGANEYYIVSRSQIMAVGPGLQTIEVAGCSTDSTLQLLVVANASFYEAIAYDLVELPYLPGEAALVPIALGSERQDIEVLASDADGDAVYINGWWMTDGMAGSPGGQADWELTPSGFAASFIAPGGGSAWINVVRGNDGTVEGWCTSSVSQQRIPSAPGAVTLDGSPPDLAQPIPLGDGVFGFVDDGPRGDRLWQSFRVDPDAPYNWLVYDDPWAIETPLVFPELPPGDPWGLDPGAPLPLAAMGHENSDAIHGYSDSVTKLESSLFSPARFRSVHTCD